MARTRAIVRKVAFSLLFLGATAVHAGDPADGNASPSPAPPRRTLAGLLDSRTDSSWPFLAATPGTGAEVPDPTPRVPGEVLPGDPFWGPRGTAAPAPSAQREARRAASAALKKLFFRNRDLGPLAESARSDAPKGPMRFRVGVSRLEVSGRLAGSAVLFGVSATGRLSLDVSPVDGRHPSVRATYDLQDRAFDLRGRIAF